MRELVWLGAGLTGALAPLLLTALAVWLLTR